ncbi:high-affinity choline transporter 1-like [Symsagittifera roscoffensis]|uniref:high-affinity choline transporter 1-like n=1 Tax=Symsagittifera roscoffensis TaxID=84072 RepID=UPI00307C0A4B
MAVNIGGLISVIFFYLAILISGLWAAWYGRKSKKEAVRKDEEGDDAPENEVSKKPRSNSILVLGIQGKIKSTRQEVEAMLAGRNIGWVVGSFTMTATWVGGGFINGTAEAIYDPSYGMVWNQAPWGYSLSLFIGGLCFAKIMRSRNYITMLDPFQEKFGTKMGGLLYLPALVGETFWSAAILAALGSTITVILDIPNNYSVVISACIVVLYTLFGGLYSVAYTDVIQLLCMFVGLWICVPFALGNEHVKPIMETWPEWKGEFEWKQAGHWLDIALLLMFGGIPWQVYFQRVLSSRSVGRAIGLSFSGGIGCFVMAIPAVLLGAAARSLDDWTLVGYEAKQPSEIGESKLILPLVLQYLTPPMVSWVGLGAVSAAVMSSADSSVLSASSMFTRNVYKQVFRPNAAEQELGLILKTSILCVGTLATLIALSVDSVFELWVLCSDIVYVVLFPNFVCCLYIEASNTYGSAAGFVIGLIFRLLGGVKAFSIPPIIKYPFYDQEKEMQMFPFRTLSMALCFLTILLVSYFTNFLFQRKKVNTKYDIFNVFSPAKHYPEDSTSDQQTRKLDLIYEESI